MKPLLKIFLPKLSNLLSKIAFDSRSLYLTFVGLEVAEATVSSRVSSGLGVRTSSLLRCRRAKSTGSDSASTSAETMLLSWCCGDKSASGVSAEFRPEPKTSPLAAADEGLTGSCRTPWKQVCEQKDAFSGSQRCCSESPDSKHDALNLGWSSLVFLWLPDVQILVHAKLFGV